MLEPPPHQAAAALFNRQLFAGGANCPCKAKALVNGSAQLELNASWRAQLHTAFPGAARVSLWSADGYELLWTTREQAGAPPGQPSRHPAKLPLSLVLDDSIFVWSTDVAERRVRVDDGTAERQLTCAVAVV
jgi:hypothetical protein